MLHPISICYFTLHRVQGQIDCNITPCQCLCQISVSFTLFLFYLHMISLAWHFVWHTTSKHRQKMMFEFILFLTWMHVFDSERMWFLSVQSRKQWVLQYGPLRLWYSRGVWQILVPRTLVCNIEGVLKCNTNTQINARENVLKVQAEKVSYVCIPGYPSASLFMIYYYWSFDSKLTTSDRTNQKSSVCS